VRTVVEVVARAGPGGRTVLPVVRASGQLAVRRTGPSSVHLVATAFGPLGGDDAEIRLVVEEGATLAVHSVAAAVALPARDRTVPSVQRIDATVAGVLDLCLEPTVVAAGAHHRADLRVDLGPDARLAAMDRVLLGRTGEEPGRWTGTTRIERSGSPLLHTTVGLGPGEPAWLPPVAPRAYASAVHIGDEKTEVATAEDAVRLPLPGGWVTTAWGSELHRVVAAVDALAGAGRRVSA
jgi:urease accessory protein